MRFSCIVNQRCIFMFPTTMRHLYYRWTTVFPVERIPFFVLPTIVSVFCFTGHGARILCCQPLCPCPYFVFQPSCPCSVFCVSANMFRVRVLCHQPSWPYSVTSRRVPNCFHLPIIFKCTVSSISIIVWNMSDAETEVFCMLLTIWSNQNRGS